MHDTEQLKKEQEYYFGNIRPMLADLLGAVRGKPAGDGVMALATVFAVVCHAAGVTRQEADKFIEATWEAGDMGEAADA
jgi:hypothetical protein